MYISEHKSPNTASLDTTSAQDVAVAVAAAAAQHMLQSYALVTKGCLHKPNYAVTASVL